jgi:spore maturation protein CgeB
VGSIYLGAHEKRLRRLAEIARQVPVDLHVAISRGRFIRSRAGLIAKGHFGALWQVRQSWEDYKTISRISKPNLFGKEMYRKLAESRIGLNIHIDASSDRMGNMRLFEVTGMGACLLTDRKSNLADFFEEGKEVVVFNDAADAVAKLKWLLSDPDCCRKIAAAGQARTIKDHSLANSISNFAKKYIYT